MSLIQDVSSVQRLYPQLYVACHSVHGRAAAVGTALSARECAVLSHLSVDPTLSATSLAKHLGVGRSTLSEIVNRMAGRGYLHSHPDGRDERRNRLTVTSEGIAAMSSVSVLDRAKVAAVLSRLTPQQRLTAIEGLTLLANAAMPSRPLARPADGL